MMAVAISVTDMEDTATVRLDRQLHHGRHEDHYPVAGRRKQHDRIREPDRRAPDFNEIVVAPSP